MEINFYDNILTVSTYGRGIWQTPIPSITRPSIDLDLVQVNPEISSDFGCENIFQPSFDVYNNGTSTVNSFSYEINLNNVSQGIVNWTGNLAPGQKITLFPNLQQSINFGENSFSVSLSNPNDLYLMNNATELTIEVFNPPNYFGQTNFNNQFEDNEDDWLIVGDTIWEKGIPSGESLNQVNSGTSAYATNLGGNHPNNSTSSLVSPCYDLSQLDSGNIRFYLAYKLEANYDYVYFQYSIDNGLNWVNIDVYNGNDSELKEYSYPISQSMLADNVIFRFHLISDQYVNEEGAVIDDFIVEGVSLNLENDVDLNIKIYPNPTTGRFTIDTNGQFELEHISIHSIEGKQVYDNKLTDYSKHEIDWINQPKGIYFIEIKTRNNIKVIRKLIIE